MNCTGQPLTPPPWLMCSMASWALSEMRFPTGPIEPVSGRIPPSFTGQETAPWAEAVDCIAHRPNMAPQAIPIIRLIMIPSHLPECLTKTAPSHTRQQHNAKSSSCLIVGLLVVPSIEMPRDDRFLADQAARPEQERAD